MMKHNVPPSNYTLTSVIKACGQRRDLGVRRVVHCHVLVSGYGIDVFVQATLVSFYAKVGDLLVARKVFDEMPDKSVVVWNEMILGYEQNGFAEEAVGLFSEMRSLGVAFDSFTLVSVLSACAQRPLS
ncbi:hypothetical protein Leryth_018391 [Lithospermum erythrorhizon]|nr:hypothetical protein Leryth_018391 [Lithospermum erythrorhizon]